MDETTKSPLIPLTTRLHEDEKQAWEQYHNNAFISAVVEAYAYLHDIPVEDVIYGNAGGRISVDSKFVGVLSRIEVLEAQKQIHEYNQELFASDFDA